MLYYGVNENYLNGREINNKTCRIEQTSDGFWTVIENSTNKNIVYSTLEQECNIWLNL